MFKIGIILMFVLFIAACGGSNQNLNLNNFQLSNLKLKAQLGTGYNLKLKGMKSTGGSDVDQVWAVPLNFDDYMHTLTTYRVVYPIQPDGSISLDITNDEDRDWVLLLVNSQTNAAHQVVSYISINDINGNLIKMPFSCATNNDIRLGSLNNDSNDEAVSTTSLDSIGAFSLSLSDLRAIARTDNLLKMVKNFYANYDWNSQIFRCMNPDYVFGPASFSNITTGVMNTNYSYFWFSFIDNNPAEVPADCSNDNSPDVMSLEFPSPVKMVSGDGQTNFVSSTSTTNLWNKLNFLTETDWDISVNRLYSSSFFGDVPAGLWEIKKNGIQTIASFNFSFGSILFNGDSSKPKVFIPSLKLNVDSSNVITGMEVSWYTMDKDGALYPANINALWNFLGKNNQPYISMVNIHSEEQVGNYSQVVTLNDDNGNNVNILHFTNLMYLNTNATVSGIADTDHTVNTITINYQAYGAHFSFIWRGCPQ